jgi:amidase
LLRYLFSPGPLARSVQDLQVALSIIAGADGVHSEVPPLKLSSPPDCVLGQLRFAWMDDFDGLPVTEDTRYALEDLAARLGAQGCTVQRASPASFDFRLALRTDGEIEQTSFFARYRLPRFFLRWIAGWIFPRNPLASGYLFGAGANLGAYASALVRRDAFIDLIENFLQNWDGWIVPVASTPAFPHTRTRNQLEQLSATVEVDGKRVSYIIATCAHTNIFNLTGSPVVVLPAARSKEGLPIGFQLVGRRWHDMELLNAAEQISKVASSFQPPPGY